MIEEVRTRFAPSPTGYMHVGGVRTALFAWLIARQNNGKFILRIEDTDKAREVKDATNHIIESLGWLRLDHDEGPIHQSHRVKSGIYKKWAQKLIESGRAYVDTYSPEELQDLREKAKAEKRPFLFRDHRPKNNVEWDEKKPLRFKSEPKSYQTDDLVMGKLSTRPEVVDDFIIIKSDGFPTYNFAHIVDDIEMEITHVIRGQEFISSLPNYLNLYEALGEKPPNFATVPHIMAPGGKKKLSKREGAKDILQYRNEGYLPEAMLNFLATLGWNDGTDQEVFSRNELIQKFDLSRVQKSGAHFDEQRLVWLNGAHIRAMKLDALYKQAQGFWPKSALKYDEKYRKEVLKLVLERLKFFSELPELTKFFFEDLPVNMQLVNSNQQLAKLSINDLRSLLEQAKETLEQSDFSASDLTDRLNDLLENTGQKPGVLFSLIRITTTQAPASPGLAETLSVLGKEVSLRRLDKQLEYLQK